MNCHDHWKAEQHKTQANKTTKTPKQNPHTKSKHQHKTPSSDVTVTSYGVKNQLGQEVIA